MSLALLLLAVVLVGVVAALAAGRIRGGLEEPVTSRPYREPLPEGPLSAADLDEVTFAPALRGYRMDEVDAVLERLREELVRRDVERARCEEQLAALRAASPPSEQG
ncbi:DivIVA domain-containing protein [Kineosporiaceae bacterium SCSIO 59966]|nr:DivIVA domain-containing protein [Kineosporiaceae bacterium SCSIO 59966]